MIKRYNGFMILVMNKKHGVGCTTLTYNLGRLFELPIFVKEDSFMLDNEHKDFFENVSKITPTKKGGVFDIGADYKKAYVKKLLLEQAKVIVIPLEFGYESIISTIETIKYIKSIIDGKDGEYSEQIQREYHTPIVLVLNRLDKQDSAKDFNYKRDLQGKFEDAHIDLNRGQITVTYLRNSYALYSNLEIGHYFTNRFLKEISIKDRKFNSEYIKNFEYRKLLYFAFEELCKTDYKNEKIYIQDKDMVEFRNKFKDRYHRYMRGNNKSHNEIENYCSRNADNTELYQESKLIKDMAFICHTIYEHITEKDDYRNTNNYNDIRRYLYLS